MAATVSAGASDVDAPADPHLDCYTPTEVRWRRVAGGDIVVQAAENPTDEPELWAIGSVSHWAGVWTVTASRKGSHERIDIDPDDYVTVLMAAPTRRALEALDDGLGPIRLLDTAEVYL